MKLTKTNDQFMILHAPMNSDTLEFLNQLPDHWKIIARDKAKIRISGVNIEKILTWGCTLDSGLQADFDSFTQVRTEAKPVESINYTPKTKPFKHQKDELLMLPSCDIRSINWDQGTGKTKFGIDAGAYWFLNGEIDSLIIFAPSGVDHKWLKDDMFKHMPDSINYRCGSFSTKTTKKVIKSWEELCSFDGLRIFTFSYQSMSSKKTFDAIEKLLNDGGKFAVLADESQAFKNFMAKRSQLLIKKVSKHKNVVKKYLLTGTPLTQNAEDLFGQFYFLDPNIIGHKTITSFRSEYCIMIRSGNKKTRWGQPVEFVGGYKNLHKLKELVAPYISRVLKSECMDLPEKLYTRHYVDMTKEQIELTEALKEDSMYLFEDETAVAYENVVSLIQKYQEILSGFFRYKDVHTDKKMIRDVATNRYSALEEYLEDCTHRCIIWANFGPEFDRLRSIFGNRAVYHYGKTSKEDREIAKDTFQGGDVQFFIASAATGGTGLQLASADEAIYFSNSHKLGDRLQSEDRNHRYDDKWNEGRKNIIYTDFVANDSIDTSILEALIAKKEISEYILNDPKSFFLIGK